MKHQKLGSSETTREAFCFDLYLKNKPQHKKFFYKEFFEWFIGFTEGKECFQWWIDRGRKRAGFNLEEKDPKVLYKIRKILGFGKVVLTKNGWCYQVWDRQGLFRLYCLFLGNLILKKQQQQFLLWSNFLTFPKEYEQPKVPVYYVESNKLISLKNAWLSGLLEAKGKFFISNISAFDLNNPKRPINATFKISITENEEESCLLRIGYCIENREKKVFKVESTTQKNCTQINFNKKSSLQLIVCYLNHYPFQGKKKINWLRWKRVWLMWEKIQSKKPFQYTEKSFQKIKRLVREINRDQEIDDIVQL